MIRHRSFAGAALAALLLAACKPAPAPQAAVPEWSDAELYKLQTLSLARLPPLPPSPSNRVADDPRAQTLGARLFLDTRLSANGKVACASCHQPDLGFSDGLALGRGIGESPRHTPGLLGVAWRRWYFWDGRADSLWAQAVQPLTDHHEHGASRALIREVIAAHYRGEYENLFGPLPGSDTASLERVAANTGKALEAFERTLRPQPSRLDRYLAQLDSGDAGKPALDANERAGLRLFIGEARCIRCHLGPLLSNNGFHNTGIASRIGGQADRGRKDGVLRALTDPLNCVGPYSDAAGDCPQLRYANTTAPELLGAFKVPTLRGVAASAPYMHDGRFTTLEQVVNHYVQAPNPDGDHGHTELQPLRLDAADRQALTAFLKALQ